MSVLTPVVKTPEQIASESVLNRIPALKDAIVSGFLATFNTIWLSENPQGVFDELGSNGKEIVGLSEATANYLTGILIDSSPEELQKIIDHINEYRKPFVVNDDGTVTITES